MNDDLKLIVSWNLPRIAADLAGYLESLNRADDLGDRGWQTTDFLEPYNLSRENSHWVTMVACGKQCVDCGDVKDYYMVYDHIWKEAGLRKNQCCCSQCLEVRLGRPLKPGEFTAIVSAAWARRQSRTVQEIRNVVAFGVGTRDNFGVTDPLEAQIGT